MMALFRRTSWLVRVHALVGTAIVGGYLWTALTGWEPARAERGFIPQSVRSSPGGYRSYHYLHSGYHGGK
ncbi:MAG TPA: hypothetical protein VFU21_00160 [Kofleriaceae bacterium]|nr:hypothetical protein [Kofleriaceae bacterium]